MLEVYIKNGCPYCEKKLLVFDKKGYEYKVYDVDADPDAMKKAREEYKADKVPVVVDGGSVKNIGFGGGG